MPKIRPYHAFFYSEEFQDQLADLVSPPYDVISPVQYRELIQRNAYNSVQLCLSESTSDPERYVKMRNRLHAFKSEGVFKTHPKPAFYLIEDQFETGRERHRRIGFVGLLEISSFDKKEVLPHEHTLAGPKLDRLELLKAMRAELSQIFLCYKDPDLSLEKIHARKISEKPFREVHDKTGVHRRLWILESEHEIHTLSKLLESRKTLIADGHHRYETALKFSEDDESSASKFVQCYFTNLSTPGFSIQPIHRLFSLPPEISASDFANKLREEFKVSEYSSEYDLPTLLKLKETSGEIFFFCIIQKLQKTFLLQRPKKNIEDAEIFSIHKDIFEKLLNWDVSKLSKGIIQYEHETSEFKNTLESLQNGVGLFLPPTDLELVMSLAERGLRMPQKSTFFYPKLASGLVNYALDEEFFISSQTSINASISDRQ